MDIFGIILSGENIVSEAERIAGLVTNIILAIMGVGVLCVGIYLAFKMVTAVDDTKRKDAKKQLIYAGAGLIGIVLLIVLWNFVITDLINWTVPTNP